MSLKVMSDRKVQSKTDKMPETRGLFNFIGEVKAEFKKISWTNKDELRVYTKIVVAATFIFGIGVYCTDLVVQSFLSSLNITIKFITG